MVEGALQFAQLLEEDGPRLVPASYVKTGSHHTFERMVRTHVRSPTSSFLLSSLFCDALCLPGDAYLDFPRTREWEAAAARYRVVFEAYAIQPKYIFLRLHNRRIYIAPHAQEFLAGLDSEWEERLTRWTLGVRNTLEAGDALPFFPTAAANTSGGAGPVLGGGPSVREQNDQGDTAGERIEGRQTAGNRDATPAGQVVSAPTATPAAATSTPSCEGGG